MKASVLRSYESIAEAYRQRFRNMRKLVTDSNPTSPSSDTGPVSKLFDQAGQILTLNGVGLPRVGHSIRVEESVLSEENVLHHVLHGVLKQLLLFGLWTKDLERPRAIFKS